MPLVPQSARTTARLAWRDLRNSKTRSAFVVAALAVSIASVSGVRGAAEVGRQSLHADSRAWLAGDLAIDTREPISENQAAALDRVRPDGIDWTVVTTSLTMAGSDQSADPAMIQVKVINPAVYPYYGALTLQPPLTLSVAVHDDAVAVSEEVLQRLDVHPGDAITIGGRAFRITAVIEGEPDRFSNDLGIGLRCLMSRASWQHSGLANSPNPAKNRILLRLSPANPAAHPSTVRPFLQKVFPDGTLRDSQGPHRREADLVQTVIAFLSVTAFLALALGALGAATALRQHAEHSMPTFAIMKMLGARSSRLAAVFGLQDALMIAAAIAIGVPLALALRVSLVTLGRHYLTLPPAPWWTSSGIFEGVAAALIALLPVLIQPALWIRRLRPAIVLRRAVATMAGATSPGSAAELPTTRAATISTALLSACALTWIAQWMLQSLRAGSLLTLAITATIGIAMLLSSLLIWATRHWIPSGLKRRSPSLRCAIANLCGPGNRTRTLIAALAVSLVMIVATFESRSTVVLTILDLIPNDRTSLYIAGFRNSESTLAVTAFVRALPGVEAVDVLTQARLQLRAIDRPPDRLIEANTRRSLPSTIDNAIRFKPVEPNGSCTGGLTLDTRDGVENVCIDETAARQIAARGSDSGDLRMKLLQASDGMNALTADQWNYYYEQLGGPIDSTEFFPGNKRTQRMTVDYYLEQRANAEFNGARSYLAICRSNPFNRTEGANPLPVGAAGGEHSMNITLAPDLAAQIGARVGTKLVFDAGVTPVQTTVASIADLPPSESFWSSIKLDCGALDEASLMHRAAVRISPDRIPGVVHAIRDRYPALAVITAKEIAQSLTSLTDDVMGLTRLVAWYAIAGGLCVLVAIVAASRGARRAEVAILSALGARRVTMFKIYSIEFVAIGLFAALIASLLAFGLTTVVIQVALHRSAAMDWKVFDWKATAAMIAIAGALSLVGGWLPTFRLLFRKPMEVLRSD